MRKRGLTVDSFSVQKAGNEPAENEDACAVRKHYPGGYRVAVADGATESSFSQLWASLLVENFVNGSSLDPEELLASLPELRKTWNEHVGKRDLPWYAKEKAQMGAFAAFLGLTVDLELQRWHAVAIGDCNLFLVDSGGPGLRLVDAFPLVESKSFGMSPYLLGTSEERSKEASEHIITATGCLRPGDTFFLTSDALAAWLFSKYEKETPLWDTLAALDESSFAAMIDGARDDGLHNDDSTLVRLVLQGEDN